jgi:hypothetical protein
LSLLDEAIAVAATVHDPGVGACALWQSGMYALNHGLHKHRESVPWRGRAVAAPPRDAPASSQIGYDYSAPADQRAAAIARLQQALAVL